MTDSEFRKHTRNHEGDEAQAIRIEPSEETRDELERLIDNQKRFQDDIRLAALGTET